MKARKHLVRVSDLQVGERFRMAGMRYEVKRVSPNDVPDRRNIFAAPVIETKQPIHIILDVPKVLYVEVVK